MTRNVRKDPSQSQFVRVLLHGCSQLYQLGSTTHSYLYKSGILSRHSLEHPTISVGNITVGGTGKTPLVQHLADLVMQEGGVPMVLSRGYGSDEQFQLKARLGSSAVGVGPNRYKEAQHLLSQEEMSKRKREKKTTTIILDDGLQHWRMARDLDVVVINAYDPWGGDEILPAGFLREHPATGLRRADLVVLHNVTKRMKEDDLMKVRKEIYRRTKGDVPLIETRPKILSMQEVRMVVRGGKKGEDDDDDDDDDDEEEASLREASPMLCPASLDVLSKERIIAVSGIGCPISFEHLLMDQLNVREEDMEVAAYPDHHEYSSNDVEELVRRRQSGSSRRAIVMTEKDYWRCESGSSKKSLFLQTLAPRLYVVSTEIEMVRGEGEGGGNEEEEEEEDGDEVLRKCLELAHRRYRARRRKENERSNAKLTTSALPSWCKHSVGSMFARGTSTRRQQIRGFHHVPVLPTETALHWRPPPSLLVEGSRPCLMVDATAGGGSHSDVSVRALFFLLLALLLFFLPPPNLKTPNTHTRHCSPSFSRLCSSFILPKKTKKNRHSFLLHPTTSFSYVLIVIYRLLTHVVKDFNMVHTLIVCTTSMLHFLSFQPCWTLTHLSAL